MHPHAPMLPATFTAHIPAMMPIGEVDRRGTGKTDAIRESAGFVGHADALPIEVEDRGDQFRLNGRDARKGNPLQDVMQISCIDGVDNRQNDFFGHGTGNTDQSLLRNQ